MTDKISAITFDFRADEQIGCNVTLLGDVEVCGDVPASTVKKVFGSLCNGR